MASIFHQASRTAIINAVTNCIGIGDITVVDGEGNVELIEVKSGKTKSSRKIRQRNQLKDAAGILGTGEGIIDDKQVRIASIPITPENYLGELRNLLDECGSYGWSSGRIAPHCYVECVDFRKLGELDDVTPKMEEAYRRAAGKWDGERVTSMNSMDIITFCPNVAPFSIFPFDDRTCIELAIGAKAFLTRLNLDQMLREFEANGWTIESSFDNAIAQTNGDAIVVLKKGGFFCHVPPGDFGKLQFEMLSPATLIEECEYIRGLGPTAAQGYGIWTLEGEATQWR